MSNEPVGKTDNLKPVRCGCGGEAELYHNFGGLSFIYCKSCDITTTGYDTEAEAIEAWNTAMSGSAEEKLKAFWDGMSAEMKEERTAKVTEQEPSGLPSQNYYMTKGFCEKCGMYLEHRWSYCPGCGARLEWE